ncbi:MAG: ABC transporter ATP-binding protein [Clostridiaceae bacterium]
MSFLTVENLSYKARKNLILDEVNVEFSNKGFYSIIGPNGSGKTTFIRHLVRALEVQQGKICLEGRSINKYKPKEFAYKISYVPQLMSFQMDFTCYDVVMMGRSYLKKAFSLETAGDRETAEEAMRLTDILHLKDRSIRELSGGERVRVFLARALSQDAQCIILDEPLAHLDINHQLNLMKLLRKINEEKGKTIIIVCHDINMALKFSHEILVFKNGKLEGKFKPRELLDAELLNRVYHLDLNSENINVQEMLINFYGNFQNLMFK